MLTQPLRHVSQDQAVEEDEDQSEQEEELLEEDDDEDEDNDYEAEYFDNGENDDFDDLGGGGGGGDDGASSSLSAFRRPSSTSSTSSQLTCSTCLSLARRGRHHGLGCVPLLVSLSQLHCIDPLLPRRASERHVTFCLRPKGERRGEAERGAVPRPRITTTRALYWLQPHLRALHSPHGPPSMAAAPSTPVVALQDDSLNRLIIDSPSLVHDGDADPLYSAGYAESPSKRTRSMGKSPARASLAPRDSNEREGLLVDFGQDEHHRSRAWTVPQVRIRATESAQLNLPLPLQRHPRACTLAPLPPSPAPSSTSRPRSSKRTSRRPSSRSAPRSRPANPGRRARPRRT